MGNFRNISNLEKFRAQKGQTFAELTPKAKWFAGKM